MTNYEVTYHFGEELYPGGPRIVKADSIEHARSKIETYTEGKGLRSDGSSGNVPFYIEVEKRND